MPLRALGAAFEIAQDLERVFSAVLPVVERGMAIQVENSSSMNLSIVSSSHTAGDFTEPPSPIIPPQHVATFGVKGIAGVNGRLTYAGSGVNLSYNISWDVPLVGDNSTQALLDGGFRKYATPLFTVGGGPRAVAKHTLADATLENNWRQCAKCGTLVFGGSENPCVAGGNHDSAGSGDYRLLVNTGGLWRRCARCAALVFTGAGGLVALGSCHAGGIHSVDPTSRNHEPISEATAPGEAGWFQCATCNSLVHNGAAPCPIGGGHNIIPGLEHRIVR